MSDFKAKMHHQIRFRRWGLIALPQTLAGFKGSYFSKRRRRGRRRGREGEERDGKERRRKGMRGKGR